MSESHLSIHTRGNARLLNYWGECDKLVNPQQPELLFTYRILVVIRAKKQAEKRTQKWNMEWIKNVTLSFHCWCIQSSLLQAHEVNIIISSIARSSFSLLMWSLLPQKYPEKNGVKDYIFRRRGREKNYLFIAHFKNDPKNLSELILFPWTFYFPLFPNLCFSTFWWNAQQTTYTFM